MFHIPTLIAVMIIVQTIMVGLLFMAWRYNRRVPAVNIWFFTFALLLVGSVLLLPRQTLPPWITIVLANSVLVTGYCVSVIGIRHYTGRPPLPWGYVGGTLALFALILGYFTYIEPVAKFLFSRVTFLSKQSCADTIRPFTVEII